MTLDSLKLLEERINILEFKLELALKLTKGDLNLTLETSKNMVELAFVLNLKKEQFVALNDMLATQINFLKSFRQQTYISSRAYNKIDEDIDVFNALSKEEYEQAIWKFIPHFDGDHAICEKIAKINNINELYYDKLADEIKKSKYERLDKESKLLNNYKNNQKIVDQLFYDILIVKQELLSNINRIDEIIQFFNTKGLDKIGLFYNGELWEFNDETKKVVINEDTYIHHVAITENNKILDQISDALKDKQTPYKDILIHLLKSGPTSSKKIETVQELYKLLVQFNKYEHVQLDETTELRKQVETNITIVEQLLESYQEFIESL